MKWLLKEKQTAFAFFPALDDVSVSPDDIELLVEHVRRTGKNGRLCLHQNEAAKVHQMIVCEQHGKFYPPHKHEGDSECFQLLRGELAVVCYDDFGGVEMVTQLELGHFYKAPLSTFHSVFPLTEFVVYFESKSGPYQPLDVLLPSWCPRDKTQQIRFNEVVHQLIRSRQVWRVAAQ